MSADKTLACRDCGKSFAFTAGEQDFYSSRGFTEPTRCADCRAQRKASRDGGGFGGQSRSYGDDNDSGGFGRESSRSSFGGASRGEGIAGPRQLFKVTCAQCGKQTEVPFEPRSGRPVYCRDCFEKRGDRR